MLRWSKKSIQQEFEQPMTLERVALEYQLKHYFGYEDAAESYLDYYLTEPAQQILRNYGIAWDDAAKAFLKQILLEYDSTSEPFLMFLTDCIISRYHGNKSREAMHYETLEGTAYNGNGFFSWERTSTSNPERLAVDYCNDIIKSPIDDEADELDNGQSDAEISAMIDEILFG